MAWEIPGQMITLPASTDLSAFQYRFVTVGSDGRVGRPAAGGNVLGVLQNKPTEDQAASVMINGVSKVKAAGSTLAEGDLVATTTAGRATTVGSGNYTIGRVLDGSSGSTDRVLTIVIEPIGTT